LNEIHGQIIAVCLSEKKGIAKKPIESGELIAGSGLAGDAHAGPWHRQVSLLDYGQVLDFIKRGGNVTHGDFGENLLVSGINLKELPIGTIIKIGQVSLEVTQIGKECHSRCQIYDRVGDCIMPREGIFARVLAGGSVQTGDAVLACLPTA
jgi:MOSC domain-containing protein YiiM